LTAANRVEFEGVLAQSGALRYTPAGLPAIEFQLSHESEQAEAGRSRKVQAQVDAIAFDGLARQVAAARLGAVLRVQGFLAAKSQRSSRLVLHVTMIEFQEGV